MYYELCKLASEGVAVTVTLIFMRVVLSFKHISINFYVPIFHV